MGSRSVSCSARVPSSAGPRPALSTASSQALPPPLPDKVQVRQSSEVTTAHAEIAELRAEVQEAHRQAEEERLRSAETMEQLNKEQTERWTVAREYEAAHKALRIREVEVRELQLLGKYFSCRNRPLAPLELGAAELAEELRGRCTRLSEEASRFRAERDLLRAERVRADCVDRVQRARSGGGFREAACVPSAVDVTPAYRLLEHRSALSNCGCIPPTPARVPTPVA